ncbi:MAG: hypothetical protein ACF788_01810, partial [Novipirellula sp. JB048]
MSEILLYYKRPDPTTWVYLSSFLTIGLFFVFHRFWSVRNLDIVLLILLAPGLLMVHEGRRRQIQEFESEVIIQRQSEPQTVSSGSPPAEERAANTLVTLAQAQTRASTVDRGAEEASVQAEAIPPLATAAAEAPAPAVLSPIADAAAAAADPAATEAAEAIAPEAIRRYGFISLFVVQFLLLIRLLLDPLMVRRPLLDPNLSSGGLTFIGISLFIFMMANIVASTPRIQIEQGPKLGPGYALMNMLPAIPTRPVTDALAGSIADSGADGGSSPSRDDVLDPSQRRLATIAKVLAILAHAAIVLGIVLIGNWHFSNMRAGVGCATLYLLMPYTAQMTGRVDHALPAALLLWAVLFYRKPLVAGIFLGLAAGLVYYPLFLLPLWISFYWRRGVWRFNLGVAVMLGLLMLLLSLTGIETLVDHLRTMFGLFKPETKSNILGGVWGLGW